MNDKKKTSLRKFIWDNKTPILVTGLLVSTAVFAKRAHDWKEAAYLLGEFSDKNGQTAEQFYEFLQTK